MEKVSTLNVTLVRGPLVAPQGSFNNEPVPAIGLAYLASSLRQAGFNVKGIDATGEDLERIVPIPGTLLQYNGIGIEEIIERVPRGTDVIGVTIMFSFEWTFYKKLIDALKKAFPSAVLVVGGEHGTALPEFSLRDCPAIDYIVMGEGEDTIVEFCAKLANKQDVKDTAGLAFLREGQFVQTLPRQRIKDVDSIPFPAWDLLPIEVYLNNAVSFGASFGRNMPMLASRGCPYQCTFCSNPQMWTTRYMTRSPDKVLEEIKLYQKKYNITGLQFYDLTAIVRKDWIVEFCNKKLEQNVDLEWSLPSGTRSEALDEEALSLLARTNCKYLVYAPESGSPETLKLIKKKINLDRMKHSVQTAIDCGIVVRANLIMGFPHETRWNMYETLKLQLQFAWMGVDEAPIFPFSPYPGSELFDDLTKKGEIKLNDE